MAPRRRDLRDLSSLSGAARSLLLDLVERVEPLVTHDALESTSRAGDAELVRLGLLVPHGYEPFVEAGDRSDEPVALTWSADDQQYGYFSASRGWVSVAPDALVRYRVDLNRLVSILFKGLVARTPRALPLDSGNDLVWDVGDFRLPGRTRRTPIWLVRCVGTGKVWAEIRTMALARPSGQTRILLASARRRSLPSDEPPAGNVLISIHDAFSAGEGLGLDLATLAGRLSGIASRDTGSPLFVDSDGRVVRLHGHEYRFAKGEQQRKIIRYLHARYLSGELEVSVAKLLSETGLPDRVRIRDYFKGPETRMVMTELLFEKDGICGFRLAEE